MNELPIVSGSDVVSALVRAGFRIEASDVGHVLLENGSSLVLVPCAPVLDAISLRRVLKAASMSIPNLRACLADLHRAHDRTG